MPDPGFGYVHMWMGYISIQPQYEVEVQLDDFRKISMTKLLALFCHNELTLTNGGTQTESNSTGDDCKMVF